MAELLVITVVGSSFSFPIQSNLGVVKNNQSQKAAQISPMELIINSAILLLYSFLNDSPEVTSNRFTEIEIGKTKNPYPIGPPISLILT